MVPMVCLAVLLACFSAGFADPCVENTNVIPGAFQPRCESDGTFSAVQCRGSGCYCAGSDGTDLGFFTNYGQTQDMNCNCARDKSAYESTGMIGRFFICDGRGNYETVQCHGSQCFCADENGQQVGDDVHVTEMGSLNC